MANIDSITTENDIGTPTDISIVVPAYDEAENLASLHEKIKDSLADTDFRWELIFCDDGSKDDTWQEINKIRDADTRVSGLRLSRNFGHQYALLAGLTASTGRAVITMDADHQHPPDLLPMLINSWKHGNKIVHTIRKDPKSIGIFKRLTSRIYYRVYSILSGVTITPGMADFRLLDRQVVDNILSYREEGVFLRGIVQLVGYSSDSISFTAQERRSGDTKYSLGKMLRFAWTGISSFSTVPLRIGIFVGLFTSVSAFGWMFWAVWARFYGQYFVPGWASALSITTFLFGILFILLGIIGDYVGRILIEVKNRPRYLISESIGLDSDETHASEK